MIRALPVLTLAFSLGACGTPAPRDTVGNGAEVTNEAALNYQEAVLELPPGQRDAVMIRAIRDANIECQQVTSSEQIKGEVLTYRARCADGRSHVVAIAADGNAQVISAAPTKAN